MSAAPKIYFTEADHEILGEVIERYQESSQAEILEHELARAEVLPADQIPANVVTLRSRARVRDEETLQEREVTLVAPDEASGAGGKISVISPLGAAVIGLTEGQAIEWPMPSGRSRRFRVIEVLFQPQWDRRRG